MKKLVILLLFIQLSTSVFSQAFLQTPIEGEQGKDWIIVNYLDWETTGFKDHNCGSKSYDGHQGTDFSLRSFKQMDSGVSVLAAAAGRVTFVQDGQFDRETEGDVTKKLGNYIAIKHSNLYYTYYGHLKKNSIIVQEGDSVNIGDVIGQVGSSGNSTDPHLHFELWYDSTTVVDPFTGTCGNPTTLWLAPESYDTSLGVFESGLISKKDLTINQLRERYTNLTKPYSITPSSDSSLNFWSHLYGLRAEKELSLKWYTPTNTVWFDYSFTLDQDYWYYYYWSFINHKDLAEGGWVVTLEYDGTEVARENFTVSKTASVDKDLTTISCEKYKKSNLKELLANPQLEVKVFDLQGKAIDASSPIYPGIYGIIISDDLGICNLKKGIN